ncbi:unnamed protein product, partial [Rotaria magnacalcarata]
RTDHEVELPPIVADSTPRSSVVKLENKRLRIMIGYSHVDSDFCHQLVDALEEENLFAIWVDFDYCHTDDLWEEIGQAIENCDVILFSHDKRLSSHETKEDENNKSNEDSSKQDPENSNQPIHEIKSISKPTETCNSQDIADWFVANKVRPELKKMYDFQCGTELLLYGQ